MHDSIFTGALGIQQRCAPKAQGSCVDAARYKSSAELWDTLGALQAFVQQSRDDSMVHGSSIPSLSGVIVTWRVFVCIPHLQRGPGWTQQALARLLDWLTAPYVTASPNRAAHKPVGPPRDANSHGGLARTALEPGCGLGLAPRALSFPPHLQPQLRQLLAALPRCPKLYDSLDEHSRLLLHDLLSVLPRRCAMGTTTPALHGAGAAAAAAVRQLHGSGGSGSHPRPGAAGAGAEYQRRDSGRRTVYIGPWIRAALEASRLRFQSSVPPPPPPPPPSPSPQVDVAAAPPAQDPSASWPAERRAPLETEFVPQADAPHRVTLPHKRKPTAGGDGARDLRGVPWRPSNAGGVDAAAAAAHGDMGFPKKDAGWWWIPDLDLDPNLDLDRTSRGNPQDRYESGYALNPDLVTAPGLPGTGSASQTVPPAPSTPGARVDDDVCARRWGWRQDRSDGGLPYGQRPARPSEASVSELRRAREERQEALCTSSTVTEDDGADVAGEKNTEEEDQRQHQRVAVQKRTEEEEEEELGVDGPRAKRPRTGITAAVAVAAAAEPATLPLGTAADDNTTAAAAATAGTTVDPKASMEKFLRALQEVIGGGGGGGDDGGGGGGFGRAAAPSEVTSWRHLETLLEQCAAAGGTAAVMASGGDGVDGRSSAAAAFPPDVVRHIMRQLLTPRLSGAAARMLLSVAVLPAVAAVERVMPRPLQEALAAAAGGAHPRALTEAVLIPAVQWPQLTPGQAQLLVKAVTAGKPPLPPPLQSLLLRASSACGSVWSEPHVTLVHGLLEAAGEGLDQVALGLLCQGLHAAVRSNDNPHIQAGMTRSVPLCRLLLSLLTKYGNRLSVVQLRQLQEAAAAMSTFMTKPCMVKLQELMVAAAAAPGAGAVDGGVGGAWEL
ncbi:hypothetical protein VOLCADRAFT_97953 [Volvox carteri f. nagariensis]|uniref:Uncharacterized protein n=1 Tax=Volvox carteri f. nagariensis TaxID=3068 RepID=D8UE22_VOLCA|nr:uncharacterized protein VOLCADRAFT_97953 [Volvox carteri f. nagariensis]EFJ42048.1 hypothetical protein VOLCADRAFT_97953 [Volvox carteri f. nagariensis]|eukprot:XP_002956923.1 hypothetical protein VOLCADRAFT_97953 [Volvox carteri f. nagariensis]